MKAHKMFQVLSAGNEETSSFLKAILGYSDIEVAAANTIADAMKKSRCESYDAYILGMRFGDGTGFELCRELKIESPHVPILFYTGDVMAADRELGLQCGADRYLDKPYEGDIGSFVLELITEGRRRKVAHIYARTHRRTDMQKSVGATMSL